MLCKNSYTKTWRRFMRVVPLVLALIALNLAGAWANVPVGLAAPPLIWSVTNTSDGGAGTLNSTPTSVFTLEFFSTPSSNASGYGEGKTFLGSKQVTTDGTGNATFSVTTTQGFAAGSAITATATDSAGNTSEFSKCQKAR